MWTKDPTRNIWLEIDPVAQMNTSSWGLGVDDLHDLSYRHNISYPNIHLNFHLGKIRVSDTCDLLRFKSMTSCHADFGYQVKEPTQPKA